MIFYNFFPFIFFSITVRYHFFLYFLYPRHLPTLMTHDPRYLATLDLDWLDWVDLDWVDWV